MSPLQLVWLAGAIATADGTADAPARGGGGGGLLSSDSFRRAKVDVGPRGERIIELAEQLSLLNPTPIPTLGFVRYGGASPSESKLAGTWKLLFTTAADATFAETDGRGVVSTSQVVDAERGTLTNVIDFERGKLLGLRVVVEGEPTSNTDIGLTFRSVRILRRSRFPRLFAEVNVRLPSRLIRWLASRNGVDEERGVGPYLRLRYVDDTLRNARLASRSTRTFLGPSPSTPGNGYVDASRSAMSNSSSRHLPPLDDVAPSSSSSFRRYPPTSSFPLPTPTYRDARITLSLARRIPSQR